MQMRHNANARVCSRATHDNEKQELNGDSQSRQVGKVLTREAEPEDGLEGDPRFQQLIGDRNQHQLSTSSHLQLAVMHVDAVDDLFFEGSRVKAALDQRCHDGSRANGRDADPS